MCQNGTFCASKCAKMPHFAPLESSNLISRKILSDSKLYKFSYCAYQINDICRFATHTWHEFVLFARHRASKAGSINQKVARYAIIPFAFPISGFG